MRAASLLFYSLDGESCILEPPYPSDQKAALDVRATAWKAFRGSECFLVHQICFSVVTFKWPFAGAHNQGRRPFLLSLLLKDCTTPGLAETFHSKCRISPVGCFDRRAKLIDYAE